MTFYAFTQVIFGFEETLRISCKKFKYQNYLYPLKSGFENHFKFMYNLSFRRKRIFFKHFFCKQI